MDEKNKNAGQLGKSVKFFDGINGRPVTSIYPTPLEKRKYLAIPEEKFNALVEQDTADGITNHGKNEKGFFYTFVPGTTRKLPISKLTKPDYRPPKSDTQERTAKYEIYRENPEDSEQSKSQNGLLELFNPHTPDNYSNFGLTTKERDELRDAYGKTEPNPDASPRKSTLKNPINSNSDRNESVQPKEDSNSETKYDPSTQGLKNRWQKLHPQNVSGSENSNSVPGK